MAADTLNQGQPAKSMSFGTVTSTPRSDSSARIGTIKISGCKDVETPGFFAVGSRGVVPHLTPDVISAHTQFGGIHMALEDFIEKSTKGTPPVMNAPGNSPLHTFAALPSSFITVLAPRRTPAVSAPTGNSNTAISIFTSTGFQVLSSKAYTNYVEKLSPDIIIGLADVPHGTTPGIKRVDKMADRTQAWLTELLAAQVSHSAVFAPILPVESNSQSEYLNHLDDIADQLQGIAFYDSNLLPDIPATTALTQLPRLSLDEPASPHHILRQISLGMDLFTIPFISSATDAGIALTFHFPAPLLSTQTPLPLGIDTWSPTLSTSLSPLSPFCTCYTCKTHHLAFIQHLLSAKEMLGWVLLQIHNHHIISQFFTAIRISIADGRFEEECKTFARMWESELPEKTGQGPRVRGYHYKSEGPGEGKKNKAAWGELGGERGAEGKIVDKGLVPDQPGDELQEKGFAEKVAESV